MMCKICGQDKPEDMFYKTRTGKPYPYCKECFNRKVKQRRAQRQQEKEQQAGELSRYTPRELIEELKRRGYKGKLTYTNEITL